jgi:hypothetical protein
MAPRCSRLARDGFDPCNRLPFHLQIYLSVPIGCGHAGMPQIVADDRQIPPRLEKRYSRAVAHVVGMKPLL